MLDFMICFNPFYIFIECLTQPRGESTRKKYPFSVPRPTAPIETTTVSNLPSSAVKSHLESNIWSAATHRIKQGGNVGGSHCNILWCKTWKLADQP